MADKIKCRFLLLSDTHARRPQALNNQPLPEADVAIHSGDLTMSGRLEEHQAAISLLNSLKADIKIVIPGNHDLTLDTPYYEESGELYGPQCKYSSEKLQQVRDLYTGKEAQSSGIHYLEEGIQTFNLKNGAQFTIYASAYTPEFCGWAFAYPLHVDRFNPHDAANPVPIFKVQTSSNTNTNTNTNSNIDIIITHGPPHTILDRTARDMNVGCPHLLTAVSRSRPKLHCFGHIHEGWGALRKSWPIDSPSPTSITDTDSEHQQQNTTMLKYTSLKRRQVEIWTQSHASSEKHIDSHANHLADRWAVYVDGTDLEHGKETLFVNAAIMDLRYRPLQRPWLVDLMLDRKGCRNDTETRT